MIENQYVIVLWGVVTDKNVGDFVGNHVGDIKGGKKIFGGNAKSGYSKA